MAYPEGYTADILLAPSLSHPLGTDKLGLDILAEVIWGARTSLYVSLTAVVISALIGIPAGLISGFCERLAGERSSTPVSIFS